MPPRDAPEVVRRVWVVVEASPAVESVTLGGSRARGRATELSDWDLYLDGDPKRLMAKIDLFPKGGLRPNQPAWEPRADTLMAIDEHFWDWILWLGSKSLSDCRDCFPSAITRS